MLKYEYFQVVRPVFTIESENFRTDASIINIYVQLMSDFLANKRHDFDNFVQTAHRMAISAGIVIEPRYFDNMRVFTGSLAAQEELSEFGFTMLAALATEAGMPWENFPEELQRAAIAYRGLKTPEADRVSRMDHATRNAEMAAEMMRDAMSGVLKAQTAATETVNEISQRANSVSDEITAATFALAELKKGADTSATDIKRRIDEIAARSDKLVQTVDSSSEGLEKFIAAVRETLGQKDIRDHWESRANAHRGQFILSMVVILMLIAVLPGIALLNAKNIVEVIMELNGKLSIIPAGVDVTVGTTVAILNRVLVFGLPAALYIWLIKYFIRFNQHSLLARDDAATRSTIMDMFVKLIEVGAVNPEDRGQVLAALLRPTVGQPTDNVDLPIIDAIKALKP